MSLPEFDALDDVDQQLLIAAWEEDSGRCSHCGNELALCSDPEVKFYPQRQVCYADMETKAAQSRYERLHEAAPYHDGRFENWSAKPSRRTPFHFNDGVRIFSAPIDLHPDDGFLEWWRDDPTTDYDDEDGEP